MCDQEEWVTQEGWEEMQRHFVSAARASEEEVVQKKMLWLYVPDYNKKGRISSITNVTNAKTNFTTQWDAFDQI